MFLTLSRQIWSLEAANQQQQKKSSCSDVIILNRLQMKPGNTKLQVAFNKIFSKMILSQKILMWQDVKQHLKSQVAG